MKYENFKDFIKIFGYEEYDRLMSLEESENDYE